MPDFHVVEINIIGPTNDISGGQFTVKTVRTNPGMILFLSPTFYNK